MKPKMPMMPMAVPKMPGAPEPVADMMGRRKPLKRKKKPANLIDSRAIERVKSAL